MHCNAVAAKLLQPTEVSKMRPERSLQISVMRTKRSIIMGEGRGVHRVLVGKT